jgi:ATP-binding cassette subfamily C protein
LDQVDPTLGRRELRAVWQSLSGPFLAVILFGLVVNALMLTGPLYMLQVHDRVLASGSEETLVALSILVLRPFLAMGG